MGQMKFGYVTKPFQHQRDALTAGAKHRDYAFFMEMGTGKTKVESIMRPTCIKVSGSIGL